MKVPGYSPSVQKEFDLESQELQQLASRTRKAGKTILRLEDGHFKTGRKGQFKYWGLKALRTVAPYMNKFCDKRLLELQHLNDAQQEAAAARIAHMTQHAENPPTSGPGYFGTPLSKRKVMTVKEAVNYVSQNPSQRHTADRSTWITPPTLDSADPWRVREREKSKFTTEAKQQVLEDNLQLDYRVEPDEQVVQKKLEKERQAVAEQQKKMDDNSDVIASKTVKPKSLEEDFKLFQELITETTSKLGPSSSAPSGRTTLQTVPVSINNDFETIPNSPGAGEAHTIGGRRTMEDATLYTTITVRTQQGPVTLTVSGMFDGHGSNLAAEFARDNIAANLQNRLEEGNPETLTDTQIWNALKLAFVDTSNSFRTPGNVDSRTGTTANLIVQNPGTGDIWVANAGDSRALLVSPEGKTTQLSEDAKPTDEKYQAGITNRGGVVKARKVNGMVGSARGIGDHGTYGASTARPKVTKYTRPSGGWEGYTLVQACDGLFDVTASKTVGQFVHEARQKNASNAYIASELVNTAYNARSKDNISVMVMPVV